MVMMVVVGVLVIGAMVWNITRPMPPQAGRDPRYTVSDYLEALKTPADTQGGAGKHR